ncbi:MAG: hypothetical protein CM1200mP13_05280 [Candidatus Pelagibacterales bacterium]|nr:MAG: hypothetical protein CM1200mP13_05280 [Pelagibacterales bacterium]
MRSMVFVVPVIIGLILGELVEGTLKQSLLYLMVIGDVFHKTNCFNILYFVFNCFGFFPFKKIEEK